MVLREYNFCSLVLTVSLHWGSIHQRVPRHVTECFEWIQYSGSVVKPAKGAGTHLQCAYHNYDGHLSYKTICTAAPQPKGHLQQ